MACPSVQTSISNAMLLIRHQVPDPVILSVPTNENCPDWEVMSTDLVLAELKKYLGTALPNVRISQQELWDKVGQECATVEFETGETLFLNLQLELVRPPVPTEIEEARRSLETLPLEGPGTVHESLRGYFDREGPSKRIRLSRILRQRKPRGIGKHLLRRKSYFSGRLVNRDRANAKASGSGRKPPKRRRVEDVRCPFGRHSH